MPVSKVTVGSSVSIQATKPADSVPPIGELPSRRVQRRDVPVIPVQDDRFFVRDSIGSATIEQRLDLVVPDTGLALTGCRNRSGIDAGLSIDRPVALASVDVFSRFADEETIARSISQSMKLVELESKLLNADYEFLMSSLKSQNAQVFQDLQENLNSEETALDEKLRALAEISVRSEDASRRLDFLRLENGFAQKIQEEANRLNVRFEESRTSSLSNRVGNVNSTSTSFIKKIEESINTNPLTGYESDLLAKVTRGSTLLDETFTIRDGVRYSYNTLSEFDKVISCCKVLSKIMAETFTRAKFPDLRTVKLPTSLDGLGFRSNFVFESNDIAGAEGGTFNEQLEDLSSSIRLAGSAALVSATASVSPGNFSPDKSIKNNNFDSIISRISERGLSDASRLESLKNRYRDAENFLKFKRAVGFDNDACSPHDLVFDAMNLIASSFPTYINGITDSAPNEYELLDALLMSFGCKRVGSDAKLNALWRAIILSAVTDSSYVWGEADPEIYDSRTESRTTTDIDGEKKTTKSNSGVNVKGRGTVTSTVVDAYYDPLKKRGFIPAFADEWIRKFLQDAQSELPESKPQSHPLFNTDYLREKNILDTITATELSRAASDAVTGVIRIPKNANTFNLNDEADISLHLFNCARSYSERSGAGSSVVDFYKRVVEKFSANYDVQIDETNFTCDGRNVTKNEVYDLIFECLSNLVVAIVNPALSVPVSASPSSPLLRYLLSGHKSEGEITIESGTSTRTPIRYSVYESFRLLSDIRSLSQPSNRGLLSSLVFSLDLGGSLLSEDAVGDPKDSPSSDYVSVRANVFSRLSQIVREYGDGVFDLAAISCISSIVDSTITDIISLQEKSKNLKDSLVDFSEDQKNDVFKCLSIASSTSALLKSIVRKVANSENFESSYEKDRALLDMSAAHWFFKNRSFENYEKSRLVFWGLPQGFTNALIRQSKNVNSETFELVDPDAPPNTSPVYFEAWLTSRPIQLSTSTFETQLMLFHPLIHVTQNKKLNLYDTQQSVRDSFTVYIFDKSTRRWKSYNAANSVELINPLASLGLNLTDGQRAIDSHILDSIHKSVVRTFAGIDIDADTLGTHKRAMSASEAEIALQLMAGDVANIIPRGSMRAINFMNRDEDGFFESLPFSRLRGRSSDRTTPSDHMLLTRFLNTRVFTKGTLSREVLLPSTFERVYCGIFNPSDESVNFSIAETLNISQLTIKAIRSEND